MDAPESIPKPSIPSTSATSWMREDAGAHDQTLEENWLFRLRRERFRSRASGHAHDYYVMHLADAVNVIAVTPDRQVVLVRQFRAGSGSDSLETPGGLVDRGEDPCTAGARELLEETGYVGDPAFLLGTVWSNPSILTSKTTIILIENARKTGTTKLDHGEEVTVELYPERSIARMIREGRIDHALVVCGLLWWFEWEFPGRLATPVPRKRTRIRDILLAIAAVGVALGVVCSEEQGLVLVIGAAVVAIVLMAFGTSAGK